MPFGSQLSIRYIRAIEENAVDLGLPALAMMESAGKCVADFVYELISSKDLKKKVLVLVGKGGNGGDGLAAARYLLGYGVEVDSALLFEPETFTHEGARRNYELLARSGASLLKAYDVGLVAELTKRLDEYDVVIDAIFGTGVRYPLPGHIEEVIRAVNASRALKVAVDIPSGIDPDKGVVGEPFIIANHTIAMHYLKQAYVLASTYVGEVRLCNTGIPKTAEEFVGRGHIRYLLKPKPKDAKKGDGGRVLVVGGSAEYIGAPALAGLGALKAGADLVYVAIPRSVRIAVASYSPAIITIPLSEEYVSPEDVRKLESAVARADSVVLGPGMAFNEKTLGFCSEFLKLWRGLSRKPALIVDADALKCIATLKPTFEGMAVLTPHRGEFERLIESYGVPRLAETVEQVVRGLAHATDSVVLLKGPIDYICDRRQCMKNATGNPGMSVGGTGDVLAGVLAAFVKRADSIFEAAFMAAYVNGLAGDMLYLQKGEFFDARDLVDFIPLAIKSCMG